MAAITWTNVTDIAPELSVVSVGAQTAILAVANTLLAVDNWGGEDSPKLALGRAYYAAHLGSMGMRRGAAGAIASEGGGGLSISYQNPMLGMKTTLQTTPYGLMYIGLAKTTAARAGIVLNGGGLGPSDTGWDG